MWILILVLTLLMWSPLEAAYTIPRFIPDGSGGGAFAAWTTFITRFDQACPTRPADWSTSQAGYYYVDYDHPSATDAQTNGNETTPRQTLPTAPIEGAYIEMGPGNYLQDHSVFGANALVWNGADDGIICLVGATGSEIYTEFGWRDSSYVTIDSITHNFNNATQGGDAGTFELYGVAFFVIRNSEFTSDTIDCGTVEVPLDCGGGIGMGTWTGPTQYIAFLDNEIHGIGDADLTGYDLDRHCVKISYGTYFLWFLNNDVYDCGGDSVQIESRDALNVGVPAAARYLFFGGNEFYHNRQTGFWVKYGMDIIFAGNLVYNMTNGGTGEPSCVGGQYGPVYVWFIGNELAACKNGVQTSTYDAEYFDSGTSPLFILQNLIHAGTALGEVPNANGHCAIAIWGASDTVASNNTIYDWPQGYCEPDTHNYGYRYVAHNIFDTINGYASGGAHIWISGSVASTQGAVIGNVHKLNYRQILNSVETLVTTETITSTVRIVTDVKMTNPSGGSYGLQADSLAVDVPGLDLTGLSATYNSRYGETLTVDYLGNPRYNGVLDAGILERTGTQVTQPRLRFLKRSRLN